MLLPRPALRSITTSWPCAASAATPLGVKPTRCSSAVISRGTPIRTSRLYVPAPAFGRFDRLRGTSLYSVGRPSGDRRVGQPWESHGLRSRRESAMDVASASRGILLLCSVVLASGSIAPAEVAGSGKHAKPKRTDGVVSVDPNRAPDNIAIIDMQGAMPRVIAVVDKVPTSVVGPPTSVAITPDESLALISASTKIDPSDATKTASDSTLTVVDLKAHPPAGMPTLDA